MIDSSKDFNYYVDYVDLSYLSYQQIYDTIRISYLSPMFLYIYLAHYKPFIYL